MLPKSANTVAKRAKIAPSSRFSPKTWQVIRKVLPFATAAVSVPLAFASPFLSLASLGAGLALYAESDQWIPKPVFNIKKGRNEIEPSIFLGFDQNTGEPICIPVKEITRHLFLLGTTGSGKTTTIRTMADSVMRMGGGFCFIDGKADVTDTYMILYEIVKKADREEDLLVLNFLNPNQSHTLNFLLHGDADFLGEILTGFMPPAQGDHVYWQNQGKTVMKALLSCLVYMRDHPRDFPGFKISMLKVQEYLNIHKFVELAMDERLPLYDERGVPVRQRVISLLDKLGPWKELKSSKPSPAAQEIIRQFGFYVQNWVEPMDMVTGVFGPIFNAEDPDVDFVDVVTNSRILIVLLPSLSYSVSTLQSLGRTILSLFKIALRTAIGENIEGEREEIETAVKRNRPSVPFLLIADEYGSYAVQGMDTILAQARSLGMGVVISVQELASLFKASETDAKRLLGNLNIKLIMKVEDQDTIDYVTKRSGEEFYIMPQMTSETNALLGTKEVYDRGRQFQRMTRIDRRDLTNLKVGEGFLIYNDEIRKYRTRYIAPKKDFNQMRLFKYVPPSVDKLAEAVKKAFQDAVEGANKHLIAVYKMMKEFGLTVEDERLYRQYRNALVQYFAEEWVPGEEVSVETLIDKKFLIVSESEASRLKDVLERRGRYEEFKEKLWHEVVSDRGFFATVLRPSEDALQFVERAVEKAVLSSS